MFTMPWKSHRWKPHPWNRPLRVALFGTSADPPHLGHQSILRWLAQEFDQVAVWAADNPYKAHQSPMHNRADMLRLLIATLPDTLPAEARETLGAVNVYQDLSDRFSIHSIARARKRWPSAHLSFVVGSDLLPQLPKWYQAEKIFDQVEILVFPRPGYPVEGPALSALRQLATVRIADPAFHHDVSSSHFRSVWCAQDSMNADLASDPAASDKAPAETTQATEQIPAVIRDYITEHNLYPCLQATHPPTPREKVSTLR